MVRKTEQKKEVEPKQSLELQEVKKPLTPQQKFNRAITSDTTKAYLNKVLGDNAQAFITSLTSLVNNSAALQQAEPMSVMYAALKAATLNLPLDPNLGFAYAIPYKDNKRGVTNVQFQIGYKGYLQLAMRSGQIQRINVETIKEGELIGRNLITGELSIQMLENRDDLPVIGYVAFMRMVNGFEKEIYFTKSEMEKHGKRYSQSFRYDKNGTTLWSTDFDAMAKKTALKQLLSKYAPLSLDMQTAIRADQAVINSEGEERYLDNDKDAINDTLAQLAEQAMEEDQRMLDAYIEEEIQNEQQQEEQKNENEEEKNNGEQELFS